MAWFLLLGAPGTCKAKVAEFLNQKMEVEKTTLPTVVGKTPFISELRYLSANWKMHQQIEPTMHQRNVVTTSSIWDSVECRAKTMWQRDQLTTVEWDTIQELYSNFSETLKPASSVIYIRPTKIAAFSRLSLENRDIDEETFDVLCENYEALIARMACPIVEVEMTERIDEMLSHIEFGVASVLSAKLSAESFWKRKMFK